LPTTIHNNKIKTNNKTILEVVVSRAGARATKREPKNKTKKGKEIREAVELN